MSSEALAQRNLRRPAERTLRRVVSATTYGYSSGAGLGESLTRSSRPMCSAIIRAMSLTATPWPVPTDCAGLIAFSDCEERRGDVIDVDVIFDAGRRVQHHLAAFDERRRDAAAQPPRVLANPIRIEDPCPRERQPPRSASASSADRTSFLRSRRAMWDATA